MGAATRGRRTRVDEVQVTDAALVGGATSSYAGDAGAWARAPRLHVNAVDLRREVHVLPCGWGNPSSITAFHQGCLYVRGISPPGALPECLVMGTG